MEQRRSKSWDRQSGSIRDLVFSPQSVWLNPPHPLPLYYHQPPLAPCLALHQRSQQHRLTRQTWPGRCGSLLPTAASSTLLLTWHHCYLRKITVEGDADSLILLVSLLAYCCWLPSIPHRPTCAHIHTHTPTPQIDYRSSVSNIFTIPAAAAVATRSRQFVCVCLSVWGFSTPEWRQETFLLPHSNKWVCSLGAPGL